MIWRNKLTCTVNWRTKRIQVAPLSDHIPVYTFCVLGSGNHPCTVANGNCSHLCLTSSFHSLGYSCVCPEGMAIGEDGRNCVTATMVPITTEPGEGSLILIIIVTFLKRSDLSFVYSGTSGPSGIGTQLL